MANRKDKPSQHQVDCYVKWLRLKQSKEYREAFQEIRRLQEQLREADERWSAAHQAYLPYLDGVMPESEEKQRFRQAYWASEESATKAQEALSSKMDETCKKFGLAQLWDPDDSSITIEDARHIVDLSCAVEVLDPAPDKRVDWRVIDSKEAHRALEREGVWVMPPPRRYTNADKEGWLTLRVNLNAPLPEIERAIKRALRFNRANPPKTRNRPDKVAEALETWVCYEETKRFSDVAEQLHRPVSTIKGQYLRACVLIYGQRPIGSIKQRRAGILRDPAAEFQAHYRSCSRCRSADTADKMCPKFLAFVTRDTKALREHLQL